MKPPKSAFALALLLATLPSCNGIINGSPDLRWWLFSKFGANKICPEMLKRSVPVHLAERAPSVGRFFPTSCNVTVNDRGQVITVAVGGTGYAFVTPARRVGFSVTAAVEYRPDFVLTGDDMYLWARVNRMVDGPHFQTGFMENPILDAMGNLPGFGNVGNFLGQQAVTGALTQGFTVVHNDQRGDDFTVGIIRPPERPQHPFQLGPNARLTFANETTDVQAGQKDFLGPFEIAKNGQALFFSATTQGPPLNVAVVGKPVGDAWREAYQTGRPHAAPPGPVNHGSVLQPGAETRRFDLPPGLYYVVLDNNGAAGGASPNPLTGLLQPLQPLGLGGGQAARVSYVAQLAN
jgi:hypothetical protein